MVKFEDLVRTLWFDKFAATGEFETRREAPKPAGSEQPKGCSDQSLARATKNWTTVIRESIGWTPVNPTLSAINEKGADPQVCPFFFCACTAVHSYRDTEAV